MTDDEQLLEAVRNRLARASSLSYAELASAYKQDMPKLLAIIERKESGVPLECDRLILWLKKRLDDIDVGDGLFRPRVTFWEVVRKLEGGTPEFAAVERICREAGE